jgi:glutaredoxin
MPVHLGVNVTKGNKMTTTRMPKSNCPVCDTRLDAATTVDGTPDVIPKEGDISLCISCTSVLEFDDNLELQTIDIKTLPQNMQDEIVQAVLMFSSQSPTLH